MSFEININMAEVLKLKEELDKKIKALDVPTSFKRTIESFAKECSPEIAAVVIRGYAPGYNDGDPCNYSVTAEFVWQHELDTPYTSEGEEQRPPETLEDLIDSGELGEVLTCGFYNDKKVNCSPERLQALKEDWSKVESSCEAVSDILETEWGYFELFVTKDKSEKSEYEPGY